MITALFKREIKSGYKLLVIFMAVLAMYISMIIAMFDPKLGDSLKMMAESMPDIFAAFGMVNAGSTLLEFMVTYLYGFLLVAFPLVFIIMLASRLMARYIDHGSMACLLATPHKRWRLATTQAVTMLGFLVILVAFVTGLSLAICTAVFPGELDMTRFLLVNVGWLGLLVMLSGLCFCSACIFNETKFSLGLGGGLCVVFMLVQMVGNVGEKFDWLKYVTPLTLFQHNDIAAGEPNALLGSIVLYILGIALYVTGIAVFSKKDLSV